MAEELMNNKNPNFDNQKLSIVNELWTVELQYQRGDTENIIFKKLFYDKFIELNEVHNNMTGSLLIETNSDKYNQRKFLITGIDGGVYLFSKDENDNSQSVKLIDDTLILSLGFTFLSFDLKEQEINWCIRPDMAGVFEFYDLDNDFLVRGEIEIYRIDSHGTINWSYGGRDIWVNIDGKREVQIHEKEIILTDFEGNEYIIDYMGKTIKDRPLFDLKKKEKIRKWWEIWKH